MLQKEKTAKSHSWQRNVHIKDSSMPCVMNREKYLYFQSWKGKEKSLGEVNQTAAALYQQVRGAQTLSPLTRFLYKWPVGFKLQSGIYFSDYSSPKQASSVCPCFSLNNRKSETLFPIKDVLMKQTCRMAALGLSFGKDGFNVNLIIVMNFQQCNKKIYKKMCVCWSVYSETSSGHVRSQLQFVKCDKRWKIVNHCHNVHEDNYFFQKSV